MICAKTDHKENTKKKNIKQANLVKDCNPHRSFRTGEGYSLFLSGFLHVLFRFFEESSLSFVWAGLENVGLLTIERKTERQ